MEENLSLEFILATIEQKVNEIVKEFVEALAVGERELYLEEHPETKANGFYTRKLATKYGEIENLRVPRGREGNFRPQIIPRRRKAFFDLGEVTILLFASGASVRDVAKFLEMVYGIYYSPSSLSRLTEIAKEKIEAWRKRKLSENYFAIYLDATYISVRRGTVDKEPVYVALGLKPDGTREILGFWLSGAEGESTLIWKEILRESKEREIRSVELFIADGLAGLQDAIKLEFPGSKFQLCVLHTVRNSLRKVRRADREAVAEDLKKIYKAKTKEEARKALQAFKGKWRRYPEVARKWEGNFNILTTFMDYPEEIKPYIYTTNMLERLMKEVKRRVKVIEVFSTPESAYKIIYLVLAEMNERYERTRLIGFASLNQEEGLVFNSGHN
ncbi:transposase IS654 family [Thermosulfidibacter takaii ABI70S6]|uniref:Mutator family transposase n=1 Tax=Thermosulfidibacter takaii (strain DSM 17441 / JCM 13301 / NBRC 103674 / ABI70S6) TaxID=1298851 RepID=A0A0S3QTX3_THET7|nr:IS256 family transposase [Thermosulfidibacter takaii]BAT71784.1 transposase IS654 family [Thermosulfidibacter takaii ABI70S6]